MSSRVLQTGENQITQHYGNRGHSGVDLVKYSGQIDNIIAHSSGSVIFCQTGYVNNPNLKPGTNATYGNCVKIKHDNGMYTLYAHMSNVRVRIGQRVEKGQVIGTMSNSGLANGAHLHFEVFNANNVRINPEPYLDKGFEETTTKFSAGTYKVTATLLNVRTGAGLAYAKKTYTQLTRNAQEQNGRLGNAKANGLLQGCIVDISAVIPNGDYIWGKIPSGYICLQERGEDYVVKM